MLISIASYLPYRTLKSDSEVQEGMLLMVCVGAYGLSCQLEAYPHAVAKVYCSTVPGYIALISRDPWHIETQFSDT